MLHTDVSIHCCFSLCSLYQRKSIWNIPWGKGVNELLLVWLLHWVLFRNKLQSCIINLPEGIKLVGWTISPNMRIHLYLIMRWLLSNASVNKETYSKQINQFHCSKLAKFMCLLSRLVILLKIYLLKSSCIIMHLYLYQFLLEISNTLPTKMSILSKNFTIYPP